MLKVYLIRHSITEGNIHNRYIGTTDEPLCDKGRDLLKNIDYPKVQKLIVSPLLRCVETAGILYNNMPYKISEGMRECDFGDFENKNYKELDGNEDYQKWIDSNGTLPFPNGESHEEFKERCIKAFIEEIDTAFIEKVESIAMVVHGGTIMSIMQYLTKENDFYKYHVKNAEGFSFLIDTNKKIKELTKL